MRVLIFSGADRSLRQDRWLGTIYCDVRQRQPCQFSVDWMSLMCFSYGIAKNETNHRTVIRCESTRQEWYRQNSFCFHVITNQSEIRERLEGLLGYRALEERTSQRRSFSSGLGEGSRWDATTFCCGTNRITFRQEFLTHHK